MKRRSWNVNHIQKLYRSGTLTCESVVTHCQNLAAAGDQVWNLNAFEHYCDDLLAVELAKAATARIQAGQPLSPLDGIPIAIKANIAVASLPLTAGSRMLGALSGKQEFESTDNRVRCTSVDTTTGSATSPAVAVGYNASVVQALVDAGAIIIGTTRMDEFGMGSLGTTTPTLFQGPTKNPLPFIKQWQRSNPNSSNIYDLSLSRDELFKLHQNCLNDLVSSNDSYCYSVGGSSSGSAAAVAHGSAVLALGSDTGGSVRLPAAWGGVCGLKPTYGRLSRHGLVSYASSLDTVGILGPTATCISTALTEITNRQRYDRDSTMIQRDQSINSAYAQVDLTKLCIGIPAAFSVDECPAAVRNSWAKLATTFQTQSGLQVEVVPTDLLTPDLLQKSLAAYYVLASAEAASNLGRYDNVRYGSISQDQIDKVLALSKTTNDEDKAEWSFLNKQYAAARTLGLHPEVVRRILCGTLVLSSDRFHTYYEAAAQVRARLAQQMRRVLDTSKYDALLAPTCYSPPVKLEDPGNGQPSVIDPTVMLGHDLATVPMSLAGLPSLAFPFGCWDSPDSNDAFCTSFQLVGAPNSEELLLQLASLLDDNEIV